MNSSKQAHAPHYAKPEKNLAIVVWTIESEQLNTMHWIATAFPRSFVVSVLPVPAGPAGAPPRCKLRAEVSVK